MHITEPPDMVGVFSPHGYTDGKGIKRDLNVGSTSPSHRISIYFSYILSFTGAQPLWAMSWWNLLAMDMRTREG